MIFTKGSGGKKGGHLELVASGRGVHLGQVVEGEEWALGKDKVCVSSLDLAF